MKPPKDDIERLEEILRQAYQAKGTKEPNGQWQMSLMARIRELNPAGTVPLFLPLFERFVWRLVPVASLLVIILITLLVKLDFANGLDTFQAFVNGLEELTWSQIFST